MTKAMFVQFQKTPETPALNAIWVITAPWAHPIWPQYAIFLYDLITPVPDQPAPLIYKAGVTHEVMCFALDPDHPVKATGDAIRALTPANWGYQFAAESDEAATARIQQYVDWIDAKQISPDTDFARQWDALFHDGVTLRDRRESDAIQDR